MKFMYTAFAFALIAFECPCLFAQNANKPNAQVAVESKYIPVHTFDPDRDAATDIERAIAEARKTAKRVLLDVGGNWCPWCHMMDQFFQDNPDLLGLRDEN